MWLQLSPLAAAEQLMRLTAIATDARQVPRLTPLPFEKRCREGDEGPCSAAMQPERPKEFLNLRHIGTGQRSCIREGRQKSGQNWVDLCPGGLVEKNAAEEQRPWPIPQELLQQPQRRLWRPPRRCLGPTRSRWSNRCRRAVAARKESASHDDSAVASTLRAVDDGPGLLKAIGFRHRSHVIKRAESVRFAPKLDAIRRKKKDSCRYGWDALPLSWWAICG